MKVKLHKRFLMKLVENILAVLDGMGGTEFEKKQRLAEAPLYNKLINGVTDCDIHGESEIDFCHQELRLLGSCCEEISEKFRAGSRIESSDEFKDLAIKLIGMACQSLLDEREAKQVALQGDHSHYRVTLHVPYDKIGEYLDLLSTQFVQWELNVPSEGERTLRLSVIRAEKDRGDIDNWINCWLILKGQKGLVWEVDMQLCIKDAVRLIEVIGMAVLSVDKLII